MRDRSSEAAGSREAAQAALEALIRAEYERCRAPDTFEDLKRRARFEKDSKGLLKQWLDVARRRAEESASEPSGAGLVASAPSTGAGGAGSPIRSGRIAA